MTMRLLMLSALLLIASQAHAQKAGLPEVRSSDNKVTLRAQPTQTVDDQGKQIDPRAPLTSPSTSIAITLTGTETFQQILPATTTRLGCMIQNKGTVAIVRIFLGTAATATVARSTDIDPGETFSCSSASGLVINDAIAAATSAGPSDILVVTQ